MIHSITIFLDKGEKVKYTTFIAPKSPWSFTLMLDTCTQELNIHMNQEQFIKFKNEILSLDRQFDEKRRKDERQEI